MQSGGFSTISSSQLLTHEEELPVDHQIMRGDHFFGLEEGIADLLVQLGPVCISQEIPATFGDSIFPVIGHKTISTCVRPMVGITGHDRTD